ncbi:hypothetical protein OIU83_20510 [Flavobacterium sp. LS1R49]|uniref:Uncharacterized protein n=1 Tax=Flavobacterium shii TaxID=2987687 RepID=A0A9X3BZB2_9FLAO|nr:hypothetical protein [Flavobacterium shii]MCV9930055.1 hypothetical protein [Flavobacterium shii]
MLKHILKLEGAQELTKKEQKNINGGVTEACARAIGEGVAIFKGTKPCPELYPISSGGCCYLS